MNNQKWLQLIPVAGLMALFLVSYSVSTVVSTAAALAETVTPPPTSQPTSTRQLLRLTTLTWNNLNSVG